MSQDNVYQQLKQLNSKEDIKELLDAGVFWGRKKSKVYPKMKPFVIATRNDIAIINLEKTLNKIKEAKEFLKEKIRDGGDILLVATQPFSYQLTELIKDLNISMVKERWVGGILTNFNVISRRIDFFKKLKSEFESGALDKYTKKEKLNIENQLNKMEKIFSGLENLNSLPNLVIIIDPVLHSIALREANKMKIPVIAFANVDANPNLIDCIVPGNTKSLKSVSWFLKEIHEAISEARKISKESENQEIQNQQKEENLELKK